MTRTFHFGRATQRQKEIYTRVLMGAIDLATLVFPDSIDDTRIDVIARQHLYQIGLDYGHGTGHGIGSFLNVHESTYRTIFEKYSFILVIVDVIQVLFNCESKATNRINSASITFSLTVVHTYPSFAFKNIFHFRNPFVMIRTGLLLSQRVRNSIGNDPACRRRQHDGKY